MPMASSFGATLSRIQQMSWDEMRVRMRQETSKRLDWLRYRFGLAAARNGRIQELGAPGRLFFRADEARNRAALLQKHLPEQAASILRQADQICRHRFDLLGYEGLDYGKQIDWHLDVVHGKRAPLAPWFKIRFLDFAEVGDHKIIWELNRHQHLVTLAKAWLLSNEERYVRELMDQWHSWQKANPYPLGINWASSLEVAFRTLSWIWVLLLLGDCDELSPAFQQELIQALAQNGWYIERYLSTYFSPNTHLLGEAAALFFLGVLYPHISGAERWREAGWRILVGESKRQVRADGVYFEQSLYYHVYALDFFLHARILAACNQMEIPHEFDATLKRMLEVVSALSQAGLPEGFGDDDGGRVFDPRRNRTEHMTDPLALGTIIFPRQDFRSVTHLTEEAIYLFGNRAVQEFAPGNPAVKTESQSFSEGGIYLMAASEPCPQLLMLDAGPQGTGRSGHGHADALSIRFTAAGRRWLIDSGTYGYQVEGNQRSTFRGTAAHNTLRIDRMDQAVEDGPFAWSGIPHVQAEKWIEGQTFTFFAGSHDGYERLPNPVRHRRFVVHLPGFYFVRDLALGSGPHDLEMFWHFASDLRLDNAGKDFLASARASAAGFRLALLTPEHSEWSAEVMEGAVSPAYGIQELATVLRLSRTVNLPSEIASAISIVPHAVKDIGKLNHLAKPSSDGNSTIIAYRYERGASCSHLIFCDLSGDWRVGSWESDAEFLSFQTESGRILNMAACGASFLKFNAEEIFRSQAKLSSWEWVRLGAAGTVHAPDSAINHSTIGDVLDSGSALF